MSPDTGVAGFEGFIPLIIMGVLFGIAAYSIGKRKGKNRLMCFLLCLIPLFNGFYLFYFPSLLATKTSQKPLFNRYNKG